MQTPLTVNGLPTLPWLPAAGRSCSPWPIRFNNKRELWRAKRAAKALNMNLNTYMRAVIEAYSVQVLNGKGRKRKARVA